MGYVESNAPGSEDRMTIVRGQEEGGLKRAIVVCGVFDGHGGHQVAVRNKDLKSQYSGPYWKTGTHYW